MKLFFFILFCLVLTLSPIEPVMRETNLGSWQAPLFEACDRQLSRPSYGAAPNLLTEWRAGCLFFWLLFFGQAKKSNPGSRGGAPGDVDVLKEKKKTKARSGLSLNRSAWDFEVDVEIKD